MPRSLAFAPFGCSSGAGIPRRLMRAEEQYGTVPIKNILRSIAVMYIPIHNQDALCTVAPLRMPCTHRDVIEQAKTHSDRGACMMAWGANHAKSVRDARGEHGIHARKDRSGGHARGLNGVLSDIGIPGAQLSLTLRHLTFHQSNVLARVRQRKFVIGGRSRLERNEILQHAGARQMIHHGLKARRPFRMSEAGLVFQDPRVGDDAGLVHWAGR